MKLDTLKLIEKTMRNTIEYIRTGDNSLNIISMVLAPKPPIDKWNLTKLRRFFKTFDITNRIKWQPTDKERIFKNLILDKKLLSKSFKAINSDPNCTPPPNL